MQKSGTWSINLVKMTQIDIKHTFLFGGKLAIERLLAKKRKDNSYVVVSERGKVIKLKARDMKVEAHK